MKSRCEGCVHSLACLAVCFEEIALKAMPLGSFPNFKYEQKKIALEPGDTVLFLSDGLEEMFDPQGEILGAARVKELVAEAGQKPSEQIMAHLKNAGKAWANGRAQEDDVTMVVVKITPTGAASRPNWCEFNDWTKP